MKLINDLKKSFNIYVEFEPLINFQKETPKSFFNYDENELTNYLDSYPYFNEDDLVPLDTEGYDFMSLAQYRYKKMFELLPSHLLYNVHGFYVEHFPYLNTYLNVNFGSSVNLLKVDDSYYNLQENKFVSIEDYEIGKFKIIYNHNIYKSLFSTSRDSDGNEIKKYKLVFQFDITQFLDELGSVHKVPIVPLPNYTEEQLQLIPAGYVSLLEHFKEQYFYKGTSEDFYRLLDNRALYNPLGDMYGRTESTYEESPRAKLRYANTATIDEVKLVPFFFGGDSGYRLGSRLWAPDSGVRLITPIVHNFFNPYEWYFFFPVKKGYSIYCYVKTDGELNCSGTLNDLIHEYVVYRYRKPNYQKFEELSNLDDFYDKPTTKKCCLMECFGIIE